MGKTSKRVADSFRGIRSELYRIVRQSLFVIKVSMSSTHLQVAVARQRLGKVPKWKFLPATCGVILDVSFNTGNDIRAGL
jgi:hypothetical protein